MSDKEQDENEQLKTLNKKRGSFKAKLTTFEKFVNALAGKTISELERVKKIELDQRILSAPNILIGFDDIQNSIEFLSSDDQFNERETFENKYYATLAKAKAISEQFDGLNGVQNSVEDEEVSSQSSYASNRVLPEGVKLPEIKLPKFDGTYETWMEFRDIFESLIHSNGHISKIQKYHYLRASLVGPARLVIQSLDFSADNYDIAWNALCERFNNKQLLIQNHLKSIFQLDNINLATAFKIRHLYESLFKHLSSLKALGESVDSWDTLLIYIIAGKLDHHTAQEWEKAKSNHDLITLEMFKEFLKKRANLLETLELNIEQVNSTKQSDKKSNQNANKKSKGFKSDYNDQSRGYLSKNNTAESSKFKYSCYLCHKEHSLFYCPEFLRLSIKNRLAKAKELKLCVNCLKRNHQTRDCNWSGCKQCGQKHNTILHEPNESSGTVAHVCHDIQFAENLVEDNSESEINEVSATNCTLATSQNTVLATARVIAYNKQEQNKHFTTARVLLDCGSQSSFVTSELCEKLNLKKTKINLEVSGIGNNISYANYKCNLLIRSTNSDFFCDLSCFVLDKITSCIPDTQIDIKHVNIPINISLADPNFNVPQPIDILIGADAFWKILSVGQLSLGLSETILHNTHLGWIITGCISLPTKNKYENKSHCNLSKNISIQDQLAKFWEIEEIETNSVWSAEERACEEHFSKNVTVNNEGRFVVSLPFKKPPETLGHSRETATKRFLALERKFSSNQNLHKLYADFLNVYEELGHMTDVTNKQENEYN